LVFYRGKYAEKEITTNVCCCQPNTFASCTLPAQLFSLFVPSQLQLPTDKFGFWSKATDFISDKKGQSGPKIRKQ
jgi:hypothetical protein